tara:strand:- start:474 stop:623 length:150 start_codon:yes stop_codon:yes gene_type:complete
MQELARQAVLDFSHMRIPTFVLSLPSELEWLCQSYNVHEVVNIASKQGG